MTHLSKVLVALFFLWLAISPVSAVETTKMGMHILNPGELKAAKELIHVEQAPEKWQYMTIPFTLADLNKQAEWQTFFDEARQQKIIPLVRLATQVENGAWKVPTRRNITDEIKFLSKLTWPTEERHIMVFNEVNHAKEWGGTINPEEYSDILSFTTNWAHSEGDNYVVLPAAMDLAAPNGGATREAFSYLSAVYANDNSVFNQLDAWNSHSYPNPGFSSAPQRVGKNSLRGFEHELTFLEDKTEKDLPVYITETGWEDSSVTGKHLTAYYQYALQNIWSNPRVVAVTPFVFKGDPGPFTRFSFVRGDGTHTRQYTAFQTALRQFYAKPTASSE